MTNCFDILFGMDFDNDLNKLLREVFGYSSFRLGQRDVLFELKELNDSQTNQTKTISNLGVPIWLLTFMALAAFWKLGWAGDFWYKLVSFF